MFTIEGKHGTAACYATNIEDEYVQQIQAMLELNMDSYQDAMKGIYSTSVCESTIDEAPAAYKPIEDIIEPIADAVDIIDVMKPIYNFEAS